MCMCLDAEQQPELYRVRVICNVCVIVCVREYVHVFGCRAAA